MLLSSAAACLLSEGANAVEQKPEKSSWHTIYPSSVPATDNHTTVFAVVPDIAKMKEQFLFCC